MGRFAAALQAPGLGAIAEVKRRSPSAGDLRPDADPARLAPSFESAGASAVSVLVDERVHGPAQGAQDERPLLVDRRLELVQPLLKGHSHPNRPVT